MSEIEEGVEEYENEKLEKKNKKKYNTGSIIMSGKKDFVKYNLSQDIDFFSDKNLDIEKNYIYFLNFLNGENEYEQIAKDVENFTEEDKKKLQGEIKEEVVRQKIGINKNIATAKKAIKKEFKINDEKLLDKKLKEEYVSINGKEKIKNLLSRKLNRNAFLREHLDGKFEHIDEKYINPEQNETIIDIDGLNIDELNEEQLGTLNKIYNSNTTLNTDDLVDFLGLLSVKNRNAILKYFNPTLSLNDLMKSKILNKEDAINILKKSVKNIKPKLSEKEYKKVLSKIDFNDIYLNIDDLNSTQLTNFFESKEALKIIVEELNEVRTKIEKDYTEKFNNDSLLKITEGVDSQGEKTNYIHNNFKDFIKKDNVDDVTPSVINSIDNFEKGAYLKVNSGEGKDTYYYIDETDLGSTKYGKHILLKNLTANYGEGVRNENDVESEMMTYEDLYKLFKGTKKVEGSNVEFLSKKGFNDLGLPEATNEDNIKTEDELKKLLKEEGFLDESLLNEPFTNLKFKDKDKNEEFYRSFSNSNNGILTFEGSNQQMSYTDFFNEFKKSKKYKLEKKINTLEELVEKSDFLKENKIVLHKDGKKLVNVEDKDKEVKEGIKHFIAETGETITIDKISDNGIEFSTGKYLGKDKIKDKKGNTKDKDGNEYGTVKNIEQKVSYNGNEFDTFTLFLDDKNKKFNTEEYDSKNKVEEKGKKKPYEEKSSLSKKIFSLASIAEVISGGEMAINGIKEYMERGNDLRAAKFAQFFGGVLPYEVQQKLRFNTTEKRKEVIEKIYKQLTEDNGKDAGEYIINNILNNKHASKEEVFAAIKYMLLKRGSLYGKPFTGKESQYIWYQKLGGDLNSAEFKKWKKDASNKDRENAAVGKKDPSYLNEENLLENVILKRLGADGKELYPRVEKDFNKYVNEGQANRFKKGEDETESAFTVTDKTDNFVSQLEGGEKSRAMGAMTKILSKNSTSTSMHFPGFLISMSGYSKNFSPSELNKLVQSFYSTPSSSLLFSFSEDLIDIYQNTIINFYKDTNQQKKADELKNILKLDIKTRLEKLEQFWGKNNEELMNFLNMKDGFIILNKGTKKDKLGNYEKYFNALKGEFDSGEFNYKNGDYLHTGKFINTSLAEVGAEKALEEYLSTANNLSHRTLDSEDFANIFLYRLKEIKENKFNHTKEEQKKLFKITYKPYEKKVSNILGSFLSKTNLKTDTGGIPKELRKYNLLLNIGENERTNYEDFLDNAFEHFYNNDIKEEDSGNEVQNTAEKIKEQVAKNTGVQGLLNKAYDENFNKPKNAYKDPDDNENNGIDIGDTY